MVMGYTIVPTECYHILTENYFEWDPIPNKQPCSHFCSCCLRCVPRLTKRVNEKYLISFLSSKVCAYDKTSLSCDFIKAMKQDKDHIFHKDDVPREKMWQIYALTLQFIAKSIIALTVTDRTKMGSTKLRQDYLVVTIPMAKQGSIYHSSCFHNWEQLGRTKYIRA